MDIYIGIFIFILIILVWYCIKTSETQINSDRVTAKDGRTYNVLESYDGEYHPEHSPSHAAEKLAEINRFLLQVVDHMDLKYREHGLGTEENKAFTERLRTRFNPNALEENRPTGITNTSFVVNKGDMMALCLREKESGDEKIHEDNILKFVALHELSHIGSKNYGHKQLFWKDFKFVLENAVEAGIYEPIDFGKNSKKYCGMDVDYNPLFDNSF
jgi:hypothetical protein